MTKPDIMDQLTDLAMEALVRVQLEIPHDWRWMEPPSMPEEVKNYYFSLFDPSQYQILHGEYTFVQDAGMVHEVGFFLSPEGQAILAARTGDLINCIARVKAEQAARRDDRKKAKEARG